MAIARAKTVMMTGVAVMMTGTASAAHQPRGGIAPTLSGLPSAPQRERSVGVRQRTIGIRFRAPATSDLAVLHTFWRRPTAGCTVTLAASARENRLVTLGTGFLPDGADGWVATPLEVGLHAGDVYHLLFRCSRRSRARLGYVLDADPTAQRTGAWRLERVRHGHTRGGRHRASPLFALAFADGYWWGQPYRALRGRPLVRICRAGQASLTLVPSRPIDVTDVHLPRSAQRAGVGYVLDAGDGTTMLARSGDARAAFPPTARLVAGTPYTLRLAGGRHHRCFRGRALVTDLPVGPSLAGLAATRLDMSRDGGRTWHDSAVATLPVRLIGTDAPLAACGDGQLDADEQCDGADDAACPGRCSGSCTCRPPEPPPGICGNDALDGAEECDGAADAACPGRCTATCTCDGEPTPPVPPTDGYRSIYASGYLGHYDPATIPVWPRRLGLMLGEANAQGPLVAPAKALAAATGNGEARFIFYLSLTDMDSRCQCFDQQFYDGFRPDHPEWILTDASGNRVTTNNGIGRLFATDVGNRDYVDAWADWALAAAERWGWDGVFVDNVFRGYFGDWSATPVNPRTGRTYTTADYRSDILSAVRHLRRRFDAAGKILVGNHTSAWDPATFADPKTREEIIALGGVELEDCVYDWNGNPHTETEWIAQLQYLDYANHHRVRTVCSGAGSKAIGSTSRRGYLLASYLLTKEGLSSVSELNSLNEWWSGLDVDLGAPLGGYGCLDPAAGFAPENACPSRGKIYVRDWERGRVVVNPSDSATVTVPLGGTYVLDGAQVDTVTLGPHRGAVLVHP